MIENFILFFAIPVAYGIQTQKGAFKRAIPSDHSRKFQRYLLILWER